MAKKLKVTQPEGIKEIPSDIYPCELVSISEGEGSFGEYLKLTFQIAKDSTYAGEQRTILASKKLTRSPKGGSKLLNILEAIGGKKLELDSEVDPEDFIGKKARILVAEAKEVEGVLIQNIDKVLPLK